MDGALDLLAYKLHDGAEKTEESLWEVVVRKRVVLVGARENARGGVEISLDTARTSAYATSNGAELLRRLGLVRLGARWPPLSGWLDPDPWGR